MWFRTGGHQGCARPRSSSWAGVFDVGGSFMKGHFSLWLDWWGLGKGMHKDSVSC